MFHHFGKIYRAKPIELERHYGYDERMNLSENIRFVVSDLDGTLLLKDGQLSEENHQAIVELKKRGIQFGIATGRPFFSVLPLLAMWKLEGFVDVIIANNGLEVYVLPDGPHFLGEQLKKEWVFDILKTYQHLPGNFCFYYENKLVGEVMDEFMVRVSTKNHLEAQVVDIPTFLKTDIEKLLMACDPEDIDSIDEFYKKSGETRFRGFKSQNYLFEFMHPSVNKFRGIERYCAHAQLKIEAVMAFGDNLNDLEMVEGCGIGVCMDNGDDEVKKVAQLIAPDHNESGFAKILKQWVFKD